jgi:hypothetical protein
MAPSETALSFLADLTWRIVKESKPRGTGSVVHSELTGAYPQLEAFLSDSDDVRNAADALALIMLGEAVGFTTPQAVVASDLYRQYDLPPDAALSVLQNPSANSRSKSFALYALQAYWSKSFMKPALASTLCILSVQAGAMQGILGETKSHKINQLLDNDQLDLLEWIQRAIDARDTGSDSTSLWLEGILPPGNAVRKELEFSRLLSR